MADERQRALPIKMILMDVDGTLTDGTLFVLPDGEEVKSYNVRDGLGILLARMAGLKTGIITGKTSRALERRAAKLRVDELHQGILDKKQVLDSILLKHGLQSNEVAYIGDDLGDLDVIRCVGLAAAVADAHPLIKRHSHFICRLEGGRGAVREFIEFILESQEKWGMIREKVKDLFNSAD
ncbi:MAG: 3-deoxy-D-manno-octulosonate 8-phosphate phosphatase [Candidatus Aminicenantes bacterium]|nr:3-deoxy-D-manno-octulosonate 8-phosphate phosphatase [Candidatus Aminicenantes bacterium]